MLVTKKAPNFIADALSKNNEIIKNYNFKKKNKNKKVLLFFWPLNFTFVCPTEIIALNNRINEFKEKNINVIGISIDSIYSHLTWKNIPIKEGGIGKINFLMVSDIKKEIIKNYYVEENGIALRATFIIDENRIIRHESINDFSLGRNIEEIIRLTDAMIYSQKNNQVCPAQWKLGKNSIDPSPEGIKQYLQKNVKDL